MSSSHDSHGHHDDHAHGHAAAPPAPAPVIREAEAARGFLAMAAAILFGVLLVRSDDEARPRFLLEPLPAHATRDMAPPGSAREAEKAGIAAYGEGDYDAAIGHFETALERGAQPDVLVYLASARLLQHERDDEALTALAPGLSELVRSGRASSRAEARWVLAALHAAFGNVSRETALLRASASDADDPHAAAAAERLAALGLAAEHGGEHEGGATSEAHGAPADGQQPSSVDH